MHNKSTFFERLKTELALIWVVIAASVCPACVPLTQPAETPTKQEMVVATINIVDAAVASAMASANPSKSELESTWKPRVDELDKVRAMSQLGLDGFCEAIPSLRVLSASVNCTVCTTKVSELAKELSCK